MPDNVQRDVILEIIHKHKDYLTSLEAALADVKTRQHNNRHMVCCLPMSKGACV